jgi:hypothetical protein
MQRRAIRAALQLARRPRLTWDDLLDLHLEPESPDWWARFQAACR